MMECKCEACGESIKEINCPKCGNINYGG